MAAHTFENRAFAAPAELGQGRAPSADDLPGMAEVYATHFKYVWRCLRALGVQGDLLDDAVQDVFVVVQRKLPDFEGQAQLSTWLYAIALRVARRYRVRMATDARKLVPAEPGSSSEAGLADVEGASAPDGEHGQLDLARRALSALDDDKREVFVLAFIEQMSAPEIARATGLPVNTVYSRMRAARLAFGAEVARLESCSPRRSR